MQLHTLHHVHDGAAAINAAAAACVCVCVETHIHTCITQLGWM